MNVVSSGYTSAVTLLVLSRKSTLKKLINCGDIYVPYGTLFERPMIYMWSKHNNSVDIVGIIIRETVATQLIWSIDITYNVLIWFHSLWYFCFFSGSFIHLQSPSRTPCFLGGNPLEAKHGYCRTQLLQEVQPTGCSFGYSQSPKQNCTTSSTW